MAERRAELVVGPHVHVSQPGNTLRAARWRTSAPL
jgi:hypothetical protein